MLFKYVYNHAAEEASQQDSLKRYCAAFDAQMNFYHLQETIEDVEETYLKPHLGQSFLDEIQDAYDASPATPMSTEMDALVRKLQRSMAYFVMYQAISTRGIQISNMGPGQAVSDDGNYIFPSMWRTNEGLRKSFQLANRRLDQALEYLDEKKSDFATWVASTEYSRYQRLFFRSARELNQYMSMEAGRVVFQTLRPIMYEAEQRYIYRVMGDGQAEELKTAMAAGSLTADQSKLLDITRRALVRWTRAHAIPSLRLRFNESNLVEPDMDHGAGGKPSRSAGMGKFPSDEVPNTLWVDDVRAGREFLAELKGYLWQNAALFPTYAADTTVYDADCPPGFMDDFNDKGGGVVSLL